MLDPRYEIPDKSARSAPTAVEILSVMFYIEHPASRIRHPLFTHLGNTAPLSALETSSA
jgi:hypothetical protein